MRAGVSTDYGGHSNKGAVFVNLQEFIDSSESKYYEVKEPWGNQALATALAAITTGKPVLAEVGTTGDETNGIDFYCYKIYISAETISADTISQTSQKRIH